jgi:catechol 2,3-dioxygenase
MSQEAEQGAFVCPTFHHFGVLTARLEEMIEWYAKVLGMKTNFQSTRGEVAFAFLSNDRAHHRMALIAWPGLKGDSDRRLHAKLQHVAFEYATIDKLLNAWERLKGCGIEPVVATDHGMTIAFYYRDPDGNSVELFVDTFGDWDKSAEYVRNSPEFHQNTMGTYLDPAQLMMAWKAGATFAELHRRAYAGAFPPSHHMDASMVL